MSIPLENLYHYIESVAKDACDDVIIYHFFPHGSKNIHDLRVLKTPDWSTEVTLPHVICHDQEPLDFDYYQHFPRNYCPWQKLLIKYDCYENKNLRQHSIFDRSVLLHSEQRSQNLDKYQNNNFIPAYYWSHALIALEWFRFAEHVNQKKQANKTFLIYNRAWTGTREYRIKFSEFLVKQNLLDQCQTTFNCIDPDTNVYYQDHKFINIIWKSEIKLDNYFQESTASANSSAFFSMDDYENTEVEVVLETLFDDSRLHFTEKILRPIALAQPFILVGSHGGLEYLRNYGFKTFDSIWDESYDQIEDPMPRLEKIIDLMKKISQWDADTKKQKLQKAQEIANYNKQYFFSKQFFELINKELVNNLQQSLRELIDTNTSQLYFQSRRQQAQFDELRQVITGRVENPGLKNYAIDHPYRQTYFKTEPLMKILKCARKYYNK